MMKYICFIFILATGLLSFQASAAVTEYQVIPHPVQIEYAPGSIHLSKSIRIAYPAELAVEAQLLRDFLAADFDMKAVIHKGTSDADIVLKLDKTVLPEKKEGYIVDATTDKIVIKANSSAGILYGIQTVRQIIKQQKGEFVVQKAKVTDYPQFQWRAFMLDEARYFKGKETVFALLDDMAALKMNTFHWHLTDDQGWRIHIQKYPKLTEIGAWRDSSEVDAFESNRFDGKPHGGFYTQDQIREIVDYAAKLHIAVIPEIEMPGHASAAIASYPWLGTSNQTIDVPAKFGVHYNVYNVADPKVIQFLENVIDEVIALFPAPVLHIGGDEVKYDQWKTSSQVKTYMAEHNLKTPADLQVFFTNRMSNLLAEKKRRMMGWNEITGAKLHQYQSEVDTKGNQKLSSGTIVHFWKGDPELIKQTIKQGYDVVNSYHEYTYLDYTYDSIPLDSAYAFNPVPVGLTSDQERHVLGLGCQMWGEFIPTVASMHSKVYPRIAAYAETGWTSPAQKDFIRFQHALHTLLEKWKEKGIAYGPLTP